MLQNELIEKCKLNNRQAQLQLYNKYCNGMFVVANRFIKDEMEAEDIVQESFIKAFAKLDQFKGEVTFGAWLKRIVINRSIDTLKSKKERQIELEETHLKIIDYDLPNEWVTEDEITANDVKTAIEQLPEKYKYVVMLYLLEGYDHQEISEILSITEVSSRTQLSRGKVKLQNLLKQKKNGTGY